MPKICTLLLALLPLFLSGQNSKFHFGLVAAPNLTTGISLGRTAGNITNFYVYNSEEKPNPGFTIGGSVSYRSRQELSLHSGLTLSRQGFETKEMQGFSWGACHDGNGSSDPACVNSAYFHYYFLDVPLSLRISPGQKGFFFQPGLEVNFMLHQRNGYKTTRNGEVLEDIQWRQDAPVFFTTVFAIGKKWRLQNGLDFFAMPALRLMPLAGSDEFFKGASMATVSLFFGVEF